MSTLLADVVLIVHFAFVLIVVGGLALGAQLPVPHRASRRDRARRRRRAGRGMEK